jgi:hypothetical protein
MIGREHYLAVAMTVCAAFPAGASTIALPACSNADGSSDYGIEVYQKRYVTFSRSLGAGAQDIVFYADCKTGAANRVPNWFDPPGRKDAQGVLIHPDPATYIIGEAFRAEQGYRFSDLAGLLTAVGYDVEPVRQVQTCACSAESLRGESQ